MDILRLKRASSNLRYHRGSFAAFLRLVKNNVAVCWDEMMNALLDLITNDSTLLIGSNYFQELFVHLHLLGLHSIATPQQNLGNTSHSQVPTKLRAWKDIPAVVCITLKVPRAKIRVFTCLPQTELGLPMVHFMLQPSSSYIGKPSHNTFAVIILAFGTLTTLGSRYSADFKVHVAEDKKAWTGSSPLIVSFMLQHGWYCSNQKMRTYLLGSKAHHRVS